MNFSLHKHYQTEVNVRVRVLPGQHFVYHNRSTGKHVDVQAGDTLEGLLRPEATTIVCDGTGITIPLTVLHAQWEALVVDVLVQIGEGEAELFS